MTSFEDRRVHRGLADVYFDKTSITNILGEEGRLIHRGHDIEELSTDPNYEKVAYLLIHGNKPDNDELEQFRNNLEKHKNLEKNILSLLKNMNDKHPDVVLRTSISFLEDETDQAKKDEDWALIAIMPSILATYHALRCGRQLPISSVERDLPADFLSKLLARPLTDLERRTINLDFVLHADHGANASSFVARIATSTGSGVYAAIAAAIATFAGPRHGGAVAGVAKMLDELGTPDRARSFGKNYRLDSGPVMGFGHRVYRVEDPRAKLFRKAANDLSEACGDRRLIDTLEALVDGMKPYRRFGISPNVDLYAAVVYRLLGIPDDLSTAVFAAARSVGWIAQIREQRANNILIRPRLLYEERR